MRCGCQDEGQDPVDTFGESLLNAVHRNGPRLAPDALGPIDERMDRQRCAIEAIVGAADPFTVPGLPGGRPGHGET